jgi:uncharacterized protein YoxC
MPVTLLTFLVQAAPADTAVVRLVRADPTVFELLLGITVFVAALLVIALAVMLTVAALRMRRAFESARGSMDEVAATLRTLTENANRVTRSVASIAEGAEHDYASVHETVEFANRRARSAVSDLADRVDEFNDALGVIQHETEDVAFAALAALKGVRAGVAAMRKRSSRRHRDRDDGDRAERDAPLDPSRGTADRPRLRRRAPSEG